MGMLRIGGLASGLDTDGLIRQLMSLERRPVVTMEQRRERLASEANAWRDLNSRLLNLQNRLADLKALSASIWEAKRAATTDSTVVTVSATAQAVPGTYTVAVNSLARAATWQSGRDDIGDPAAQLGVSGSIRIVGGAGDGEIFAVEAGDSLNAIAARINKESGRLAMTASVIQVNPGDYRLILTGQTGASNQFTLEDADGGGAATALQLDSGTAVSLAVAANGSVTVNSVSVTVAENTVKEVIPGVTLTLLREGASATVTVSRDEQKVVDAVKAFVDQYNSVVDFIDQQVRYDSKTKKAGALFGQGMVQSIQTNLNLLVTSPVDGLPAAFNSLGMAGITGERFSEGNALSRKLRFDEARFREALGKDSDAVRRLFAEPEGTGRGVAVRAEEWLQGYTRSGGLVPGRAGTLEAEMARIKERVARYEEVLLPMKEKRLRDQFTALEKALASFQGQGDWLSMQINSLTSSSRR